MALMDIPPADIGYLFERLPYLADALQKASDDSAQDSVPPEVMCDALSQLLGVLREHEDAVNARNADDRLGDAQLTEMIEYGIRLFSEAGRRAQRLNLPDTARDCDFLILSLVLWGARHGAEITRLEPVVNSLAALAAQSRDPQAMTRLLLTMNQVVEAVSPSVIQSDDTDKSGPWRILLLNRAIVATRTHQPKLMEPTFDAIVEWIPEEASHFFTEGMGQMDIIGYPAKVRELMQSYYLRHSGGRTLH
jgi:hypothetical protein